MGPCIPILLQAVTIWWRPHQRDVSVFILMHGDTHDALELGRVRLKNAGQSTVEAVLTVVQRFAAEKQVSSVKKIKKGSN